MKNWCKTYWLAAGLVITAAMVACGDEVTQPATNDAVPIEEAAPAMVDESHADDVARESSRHRRHGREPVPIVVFGKNFTLRSNETAEVVVVLGGSSKIQGRVNEVVVSIGGDVEIDGGDVDEEVVAVFGNVRIGPESRVGGDVVSVGGEVSVADSATVGGEVQPVSFQIPYLSEIRACLVHCVMKFRLLAPQVGWVWLVFGAFFLFYLLVAVALPRPVEICLGEITRRPATTFFMAILTKLLLPVIIIVLAATGIGVVVIPFLLAALFFGALIGKVAFLEYLGFSLGKLFGSSNLKPALALVIGAVLLALLYMVPILALVVFAITGLWGLGAAVTASFSSLRRETDRPPVVNPPAAAPVAATMAATPMTMSAEPMISPMTAEAAPGAAPGVGEGFFAGTMPATQPVPAPVAGEAYALPRASFWERMGAGLLDMVLAGALCGFVGGPPFGFLVILAYFVGMWAWKGTTIGGLVANLKVVRLDDKPVTIVVALVRGLGAAFSAMVFFLGFFWIAWDRERQGWHDMIAGTVVVRVPRGRSLV